MSVRQADVVIIGGGIVGLTIALEIKRRWWDRSVIVLEKEPDFGLHASGRNSGVLHAGFYYTPDSLKAKLTRDGNRLMTQYCLEKGLPIRRTGKVVVASNEREHNSLLELYRRGQANGVQLELVDASTLRELEPKALTMELAIFSPTTSSVDPRLVIREVASDVEKAGVRLALGRRYLWSDIRKDHVRVVADDGPILAGLVVNAAGLYADRVAHEFGVGSQYRVQPFMGLYLNVELEGGTLSKQVYPVPDIRNPFLGVHFTIMASGQLKIGPTATPALWREQYRAPKAGDVSEVGASVSGLLKLITARESSIRNTVVPELAKYSKSLLLRQAKRLLQPGTNLRAAAWGHPGVRAQICDWESGSLVNDFLVLPGERSLHVLNAVSPAFTSSFAFAAYIVDKWM